MSIGGPPIADFLHASLTGLVQVFAWPTFGLMLIGMALGFVVGHLPGLGGPTTLALMLPLFEKGLAVLFPPGQLLVWLGYGG